MKVASEYHYYCDLATYHQWSRLKVRQRNGSDAQTIEIVISLHSLGQVFSGVVALSGYVADRNRDDDGQTVSGAPRRIAERPLSFTYTETADDVSRRARDWLDMGLNVALESFRKSL